jgi:hypothetical protein
MMSNVTSRHPNRVGSYAGSQSRRCRSSEARQSPPNRGRTRDGKSEAAVEARDIRTFVRESKCFCTHKCNMSINLLFNSAAYPPIAGEMMREAAGLSLIPGHGASPEPAASALAPQAQAQATLHREAGVAPIRMPTRRKS